MLKSSFPHHHFFKPQPRAQEKALSQGLPWREIQEQVLLNVENKNSEQRDPKSTVT